MLSTSINGQGRFSCRRSIRMTVCHRAGFFSLVAELDVRARAQSPGALSLIGQADEPQWAFLTFESSVGRVAMAESACGCGGKRRSLIRVDTSGHRSSSVQ